MVGKVRQVEVQERLLRRAATEATLHTAKHCFLIKRGEDYEAIECTSKISELFMRLYEFFNPFVSIVGVEKEYKAKVSSGFSDLEEAIKAQKKEYTKVFRENDPEKIAALLKEHYQSKAGWEASSTFQELKTKLAAKKYFEGKAEAETLYQQYEELNKFVDDYIIIGAQDAIERVKKGINVPQEAAKFIFYYHFYCCFVTNNEKDLQVARESLKSVQDALTRFQVPESHVFAIQQIRFISRWLKTLQSLQPQKEEAMRAAVTELESVQAKLIQRYDTPQKVAATVTSLEGLAGLFKTNQATLTTQIEGLEKQEARLQAAQQDAERAFTSFDAARERIARFDFALLPQLPMISMDAELPIFQEDMRLPVLRDLRAKASDPEAFKAAFGQKVKELEKELLEEIEKLSFEERLAALFGKLSELEKSLQGKDETRVRESLNAQLQVLSEKLRYITPGDYLKTDYLEKLTPEAFDKLRDKLQKDIEQSGGWFGISFGISKEEATKRFQNYTENFETIRVIVQRNAELVKQLAEINRLKAEIAELKNQKIALNSEIIAIKTDPQGDQRRKELVSALKGIVQEIRDLDVKKGKHDELMGQLRECQRQKGLAQQQLETETAGLAQASHALKQFRAHFTS